MMRLGTVTEINGTKARVQPDADAEHATGWMRIPKSVAGLGIGDRISFAYDDMGGGEIVGVFEEEA